MHVKVGIEPRSECYLWLQTVEIVGKKGEKVPKIILTG